MCKLYEQKTPEEIPMTKKMKCITCNGTGKHQVTYSKVCSECGGKGYL